MIKVMVVIYGLVMLVPQGGEVASCNEQRCSAETLTAIFLESEGHEPMIRWVDINGGLEGPWKLPGPAHDDFEVQVTGPGKSQINLDEWTWFPRLHQLARTRVREDCLEPGGECKDRGKDLTHGVLTLKGKWTAKPATYCHGFRLPIGYHDEANMKFPRYNGSDRDTFGEKDIGTALVLTSTLDSEAWKNLQVMLGNDDKRPAELLKKKECEKWIGEGVDSCAVLILGNRPHKNMGCSGPEDCRHDRHFSAFYLLTTRPGEEPDRRIPYVTGSAKCPKPDIDSDDLALYVISEWIRDPYNPYVITNMPAVRCPPAFALLEEINTSPPPAPPPPG